MPTLRSATISALLNGMHDEGGDEAHDHDVRRQLEERRVGLGGTMSSFMSSLMPSASHCRMPCGPTRFGPMRDWMRAQTRRSTKVVTPATLSTKPKMIDGADARRCRPA